MGKMVREKLNDYMQIAKPDKNPYNSNHFQLNACSVECVCVLLVCANIFVWIYIRFFFVVFIFRMDCVFFCCVVVRHFGSSHQFIQIKCGSSIFILACIYALTNIQIAGPLSITMFRTHIIDIEFQKYFVVVIAVVSFCKTEKKNSKHK